MIITVIIVQVVDSRLAQNSCRSGASDEATARSWRDAAERTSGASDSAADDDQRHRRSADDGALWQPFHEYDQVYVPHSDATAMGRRVDDDTSYVRTLQSRRRPNVSPYEEVRYLVRPMLLVDRPPTQHMLPTAPPRTSSIGESRLQNILVVDIVGHADVDGGPSESASAVS